MNSNPKILVALTSIELKTFLPESLLEQVKALSGEIEFVEPTTLDAAAWLQKLQEVQPDVLLAAWATPPLPDAYVLGDNRNLKYVCYLPGSVRKLTNQAQLESGLLVTNWGNSISRTVAETGLMLAIGALRGVGYWAPAMHRDGAWKDKSTVTGSLFERHVGLHGFGAISRELVKLLQPFDVKIMTYSPSVPDSLLEEFGVSRAADLDELFGKNDVIVELAALTPRNKGIVDERLLRMIPEGGAFVNVGRGAVVDEEALLRVAKEGKIAVALDVYGVEPLPVDSAFRGLSNVLLLPHLGGPTTDRRQDSGRLALKNLKLFVDGQTEAMESVVTPDVYARAT